MKYIKSYKIFEQSSAEISQTIEDICQDLKDDGFSIEVERGTFDDIYRILVFIRNERSFTYEEISNVVDRITTYLKELDYIRQDDSKQVAIKHNMKSHKCYTLHYTIK